MSNAMNGCGSGNCACKSAASVQRRDPLDETDYGTPLRHADIDVTLEIDGDRVTRSRRHLGACAPPSKPA